MMQPTRLRLDQINILSANPDASVTFYGRIGIEIPEENFWRTPTGTHYVNVGAEAAGRATDLELDSISFASIWKRG